MKKLLSLIILLSIYIIGYGQQENLALRSDVIITASGFTGEIESPNKARDGDAVNSKWCDNINQDKFLLYDLGDKCKITKFILNWEDWHKTKKYKIFVGATNTDWKEVVNEENNNNDPSEYFVKLDNVRYVMFLTLAQDESAVMLKEFEVWGTRSSKSLPLINLAKLPETIVSASGYANEDVPDKVRDGDFKNNKWSDNVKERDKWIAFKFPSAVNIRKINLDWEDWDVTQKYTIQVSENGQIWKDAIIESNNSSDLKTYEVDWNNIKQLRLFVKKEDDDAVRLFEMEIIGKTDAPLSQNLALDSNTIATASGQAYQDAPEKAKDGVDTTIWSDIENHDKWLMYQFPKPRNVNKVSVSWLHWDKSPKYTILCSKDGKNWNKVITENNNTALKSIYEVNLKEVKFIKIFFNKEDDDAARIGEFAVYGME